MASSIAVTRGQGMAAIRGAAARSKATGAAVCNPARPTNRLATAALVTFAQPHSPPLGQRNHPAQTSFILESQFQSGHTILGLKPRRLHSARATAFSNCPIGRCRTAGLYRNNSSLRRTYCSASRAILWSSYPSNTCSSLYATILRLAPARAPGALTQPAIHDIHAADVLPCGCIVSGLPQPCNQRGPLACAERGQRDLSALPLWFSACFSWLWPLAGFPVNHVCQPGKQV